MGHGGKRKGAGRKPKIEELKLIEQLDDAIDKKDVLNKLGSLISKGNMQAVKLYFEYRFGKPKESIDVHTSGENTINFVEVMKAIKSGRDK